MVVICSEFKPKKSRTYEMQIFITVLFAIVVIQKQITKKERKKERKKEKRKKEM